jgi:PQQ-dependent catabolism-associated CXXCW motif protein
MRTGLQIAAILMVAASPASGQTDPLFGVDGYRVAHYRAPARRPPEGVTRIAPAAAAQLRPDRDALFIDVVPAAGGHREADGRWRLAAVRQSIPGAHWFPESGRGDLTPGVARWFAKGVARLSQGRKDRPIVVFCLADCWMSWNAARRLKAFGYAHIWWLAEGTDGWQDLDLPLVRVAPEGGALLP